MGVILCECLCISVSVSVETSLSIYDHCIKANTLYVF